MTRRVRSVNDEDRDALQHELDARWARTRVVRALTDVEVEPVAWLWPHRLPIGKLVVLDGDPSVGKSTVALDLAARVSSGRAMPDEPATFERSGRAVVLMSAEDGLADTIKPRLLAAGADLTAVFAVTAILERSDDDRTIERPPAIPDDLDQLEATVVEHRAALVVIDVLTAYLSSETNSYRDQDVRRALAPVAAMAERQRCCVVVLRHLRKASTGSAIYAGGGSIAIVGAARVGLMAAYDPDDAEVDDLNDRRRVLAVVKNNVGRLASSLSYRIVPAVAEGVDVGLIEWLGEVGHRADDLVDHDARDSERSDKETFLRSLLGRGPVPVTRVEKEAHAFGWSLKQLRRVLRRLGGQSEREGFEDGRWVWTLPGAPRRSEPAEDALDAHSENGHVGHLRATDDVIDTSRYELDHPELFDPTEEF